jgi:hypothetical protein
MNLKLHSMNKLTAIVIAPLALAAVCLLPGCSKSDSAKSSKGTGAGADTASAPPAGPVTLKVNWTVGKEYAMRIEESETVEFNVPDEPKPVKQMRDTTTDYAISVLKELADGGRELELKVTAVKANFAQGDRETITFDSAQDTDPNSSDPAGPILHRLLNEHVRVALSADGKTARVDGFKEFANRVIGNGSPQARNIFYQMFNEDGLKQLGTMAEGLPDNPVKAGDHWPATLEFPAPIGIIVINLKNTFKEWETRAGRQCVRIAFKGDISSKPNPNSPNTSAKLERGDITGETWFDPALGMVVQSDDAEEMPLQIKNRGRMLAGQVHRKASRTLLGVTDIGK